jgi:hypothetical protein
MNTKQLLTTSSVKCFNRCRREYQMAVEQGMRSIEIGRALNWGRVWDAVMAYLWMPENFWDDSGALLTGQADPAWLTLDEVDRINVEVLATGYVEYWREAHQPHEASDPKSTITRVAAKLKFECPLRNPDTGRTTPLWSLAGELDAMALVDGRELIVEHKSSGLDVSAGSTYWEKLKIDSQCSNYFEGARALGYEPLGVLYDVVRKPLLKHLKATPEEDRKYKKDGSLHANQRDHDESLDEYRARLVEDVAARPDFYFARGEVVRLESEELAAAGDMWESAQAINQCQRRDRWARNTESCERYHKLCSFWPVCTGSAQLDDKAKYQHVGSHPELAREEKPDDRCEHCKEFDDDGCHNCGPATHSKLYGT